MRSTRALLILSLLFLFVAACSTESTSVYELSANAEPSDAGVVDPTTSEANEGESIVITATPNDHWRFDRWTGGISGNENPSDVVMDSDKQVTALFVKREYPLTVNIESGGTYSERVLQSKSTDYPHGTLVELEALPDEGYDFDRWSGDISSEEPVIEALVDSEIKLNLEFSTAPYLVTFGGSENDFGNSISRTKDGGLIITGSTESYDGDFTDLNNGQSDIFVLKTDSNGNKEWIRTFGGSFDDKGISIAQNTDGEYVLIGSYLSEDGDFKDIDNSPNHGLDDVFVMKLNSNGKKLWIATFEGTRSDNGNSISIDPSGNIYVTGTTNSSSGDFQIRPENRRDIFIAKLKPNGEKIWLKTVGGTQVDYGRSITITQDQRIFITGESSSIDGDFKETTSDYKKSGNIFVSELNPDGELVWLKTYGGREYDVSYSISYSSRNEILITGSTTSYDGDFDSNNGGDDIFLIKLNSTGSLIWSKTIGGSLSDQGHDIIEESNGHFVITGHYNSKDGYFSNTNAGGSSVFLIKFDSNGEIIWSDTYSGSLADRSESLTQLDNGEIVIAGSTRSIDEDFSRSNSGKYDVFILKVTSSGDN